MRYLLAILVVFLQLQRVSATSGTSSQEHTRTYLDWKAGLFNGTFYLPETYLGRYDCLDLGDNQSQIRRGYLALLNQTGIDCRGEWCSPDG